MNVTIVNINPQDNSDPLIADQIKVDESGDFFDDMNRCMAMFTNDPRHGFHISAISENDDSDLRWEGAYPMYRNIYRKKVAGFWSVERRQTFVTKIYITGDK